MSELPLLTHAEAKTTPKRIVLIKDHLWTNVKNVGRQLRSYLGVASFAPTRRRSAGTRSTLPNPRLTNCHNNTLALARDLWRLDHHRWHIFIGSPGDRGFHSWIEFGDAAADTTYDRIIVSERTYHHGWSGIAREANGFTGPNGCDEYSRRVASSASRKPRFDAAMRLAPAFS